MKSPIKSDFVKKKYCEEVQENRKDYTRPLKILSFIVYGVFFIFWIIVCPLTWALLNQSPSSEQWPHYWPYILWTVAFIIWLIITSILIFFWRRQKIRKVACHQTESLKSILTPKYVINVKEKQPEIMNMTQMTLNNDQEPVELRRNLKEERSRLPPLIIHPNITGQNENKINVSTSEDKGNLDTPGLANSSRISREIGQSSIKEYLKIVTVETPSPAKDSPKSPLSPRELFFIDLIREADKKEPNIQTQFRKSYFFSDGGVEKRSRVLSDTRRYTMGGDQFGKLIASDPDSHLKDHWEALSTNIALQKRMSKSETKIPQVVEEIDEDNFEIPEKHQDDVLKKSKSEQEIYEKSHV